MDKNKILQTVIKKDLIVIIILLLLILTFSILTPNHSFATTANLLVFCKYCPEIALITMGMAIVMITGEFDLSVGSIYVLSSVIFAYLIRNLHVHFIPAGLITLASGCLMGFINGFLLTRTKITSFIVTLGTNWAFRGIMLVWVGGGAVKISLDESQKAISNIFTGKLMEIPLQFIWLLVITFFLWVFLHHTQIGVWIYATGSNKRAGRMMGVNTDGITICSFVLCGFLCAFAGFIQVSRMNHAIPQSGETTMMISIAGAIIGGVSLNGGRGGVIGALLGAFVYQVISLGFIMLGFIEYYTNIVMAVALIAISTIYNFVNKELR